MTVHIVNFVLDSDVQIMLFELSVLIFYSDQILNIFKNLIDNFRCIMINEK